MIILRVDYNTLIAVPEAILPHLASCVRIKEVHGEYLRDDRAFEVLFTDATIKTDADALAIELAAAKAEADQHLKWYRTENEKVKKLEAERKSNG
jgi:hypothetical protein